MPIADRLFTNGAFHTLDPDNPAAEALASWRGRIIGVGARADLEALKIGRAHVSTPVT